GGDALAHLLGPARADEADAARSAVRRRRLVSCRRVRDWLHRGADALDEAQRLVLDDHLAACERCRGERARMRLLHRVGTSLEAPPPHDRAYHRAIARALLEGGVRAEPRVRRPRWPLPLVVAATTAAAAAAAALAITWIATRGDELRPAVSSALDRAAPAPAAGAPPSREEVAAHAPAAAPAPAERPAPVDPPAPADRIESGALRDENATLARGAAIPPRALLRAVEPTRVHLASAVVVVAASAELRWLPAERTLLLERGRLDVETAPEGVARIVTPRFEIELEDASLTVEPGSVRIHRGAARIVDRAAHTIVARLESGGAWTSPEPGPRPARTSAHSDAGAPSASQLLALARARFAARDHAAAERAATAALAATPSQAEAAEAHTLLADIALAAGDLDKAVARYTGVATRFADLPAAESALYAAARVELRRGHRAEARALYTRYLARYPSGRYADDVRRQLTSIP